MPLGWFTDSGYRLMLGEIEKNPNIATAALRWHLYDRHSLRWGTLNHLGPQISHGQRSLPIALQMQVENV
ncbi:hypothetical protein GCM10023083_73360 [Streptomyces phyllanthi]